MNTGILTNANLVNCLHNNYNEYKGNYFEYMIQVTVSRMGRLIDLRFNGFSVQLHEYK